MAGTRLVPAVERASLILDRVSRGDRPTLSQLVRSLGLPKSSAHGLCATLCALGLMRDNDGRFELGPRIIELSSAYLSSSDLVREFQLAVDKGGISPDYTLTLSTLDGADVVYLACRNSNRPLGVTFRVGMRLPAIYTATGKAILAQMPAHTLQDALAGGWPARLTDKGVRDRAALDRELAATRQSGYSVDDGQVRLGLVCLGAAIAAPDGRPIAAVALSMTESEASPPAVAAAASAIRTLAARLSGIAAA